MASPTKKKKNRSKLGRGLSALVDQGSLNPVQVAPELSAIQRANIIREIEQSAIGGHDQEHGVGSRVMEIDVASIIPNPHQPRRAFDEDALEELAGSIVEHGLLQPIVVRAEPAQGAGAQSGLQYELIAGERRWRATCKAGLTTIRAIVVEADYEQSAQLALIENIQREDLNPIELAHGLASLATDFSMTQEQIAQRMGMSRSSVANVLRLVDLDDEIQGLIASGSLGSGHAKVLLGCKDLEMRTELAMQCASEQWTVRALEQALAQYEAGIENTTNNGEGGICTENTTQTNAHGPRLRLVLEDLEQRMSEQLSTKVQLKADRTGTRGHIRIEFYDLDHFDGLLSRLGVVASDDLGVPEKDGC